MKKLNNEIFLGQCQDERIWIHSNTLGYGKWVSTLRLVKLIKDVTKEEKTGATIR